MAPARLTSGPDTANPDPGAVMRTCLVAISSSSMGGAQRHVYDLARWLLARGWRVIVAAPDGSLLEQLAGLPTLKTYRLSTTAFSVLQLIRILHRERPQVAHFHLLGAALYGTLATWFARRMHAIYTVHNEVIYPGMLSWKVMVFPQLNRIVARCAMKIVVVSAGIGSFFEQELSVPRDKIAVIHNGVCCKSLEAQANSAPTGLPAELADRFIVGTVGRLALQKGHHLLIEAIAQIREEAENIVCVIVGDGPAQETLRSAIRNHRLEQRVFLVGPSSDVGAWYARFHLAVFPSLWEGMPIAHLEAGGMGLPIIATDVGDTREIIQHGHTGLLLPPGDAKAIATAILALYHDQEKRDFLGTNAQRLIRSRFTVERCCLALEQQYLKAIQA